MRQEPSSISAPRSTLSLRMLLVDDNPLFLVHLARWLSRQMTIDIVGQAHSGREGVLLSEQLRPDVILMDTGMMPMNGFDTLKQIKHARVSSRIVLMSTNRLEEYSEEFILCSDGFVQKDELFSQLFPLLARLFPYHRL